MKRFSKVPIFPGDKSYSELVTKNGEEECIDFWQIC